MIHAISRYGLRFALAALVLAVAHPVTANPVAAPLERAGAPGPATQNNDGTLNLLERLRQAKEAISGNKAATPATTAAPKLPVWPIIEWNGAINERPELYNFIQEDTKTLREWVEFLGDAAKDPSVEGLIVRIESPQVGWARMMQLRRALLDFRASGKKVYAHLGSDDTLGYLLATGADKIVMPEASMLFLTGLRANLYFFKDTLGKAGLEADVVAIGKYKDAMESLTNSTMSEGTREVLTSLVDDLTTQSVQLLVAGRKMSADRALAALQGGPYTATEAIDAGLIDNADYLEEIQQSIENDMGHEIDATYDYGAKNTPAEPPNFLELFSELMKGSATRASIDRPFIAVVYATGEIVPGRKEDYPFSEEIIAQDDFIDLLNEVAEERNLKAIVLRIDSPGGSAETSDVIWNMLHGFDVPVIVSMGDVAASGGYYLAMAGDTIVAEATTLTGSIGVIGGKIVMGKLYENIGVKTESIGGGKYSNLFSERDKWSPEERKRMTELMEDTYKRFVSKAASDRKMEYEALHKVAQGRVWTGQQAKRIGLVDELGGMDTAIAIARVRAGEAPASPLAVVEFPRQEGFIEYLEAMFGGRRATARPLSAGRASGGRGASASARQLAALFQASELLDASLGRLSPAVRSFAISMQAMRRAPISARAPYHLEVR